MQRHHRSHSGDLQFYVDSDSEDASGTTMKCVSCREEYKVVDAGTCRECYEEASETEEELKREIEDLKAIVSFLRFWSPLDHSYHPFHYRSTVPCFTDVVLVASEDQFGKPVANPVHVPAHKAVWMAFRRGRGRGFGGGGGFRVAKQVPFEHFPEMPDLPDIKSVMVEKDLVIWSSKLQTFWNSSPYYYEGVGEAAKGNRSLDEDAERSSKMRTPLSHFIRMTDEYVPAELGERKERHSRKKVRWNPESDQLKLDLLERLEKKDDEKGEKEKKDDEDQEEDDEASEQDDDDDEDEEPDDYTRGDVFDDDEDDFNAPDDDDDEATY